jgi:hypothetical protein
MITMPNVLTPLLATFSVDLLRRVSAGHYPFAADTST